MELTSGDLESYRAMRDAYAGSFLDDRRAVEFAGAERLEWLQRQVTQDLTRLAEGPLRFCLCEPTGHLFCAGLLVDTGERSLALIPEDTTAALLRRVEEAVILEDVVARVLDERIWTFQGPESPSEGISYPLASGQGRAVLVRAGESAPAGPVLTPEALRIGMLERGIPRWGIDMDARTLPPELGPAFEASHVAYGKGCYTGQEVMMRIHSRGHVNRQWAGLIGEGDMVDGTVAVGDVVVGRVTSAAFSPSLGAIAGAMLRAEASKEGEIVSVITPTATVRAEVRQMPLLRTA